jgi:hypothetical protein
LKTKASGRCISLLVFLFGIALLVPALSAIGDDENSRYQTVITNPEIPAINQSEPNETALESYKRTPEPITVFKAEVNETSMPGPRYMAFGPSVIELSVSPAILIAFAVLVVLGIGAWFLWAKRQQDDEDNT